jgi:hypothetical protein
MDADGKSPLGNPDPQHDYRPGGVDEVLETLADGTKIKIRMLRMRACTEKDAKGKMCRGHLKRWFQPSTFIRKQFGDDVEVYRCERCRTIYLPNPAEPPRTRTLAW